VSELSLSLNAVSCPQTDEEFAACGFCVADAVFEIEHTIKSMKRGTVVKGERRYCYDIHAMHKVFLQSIGECYALDITGAQYGWSEAAMPWDEYEKTRVGIFLRCCKFGSRAIQHWGPSPKDFIDEKTGAMIPNSVPIYHYGAESELTL